MLIFAILSVYSRIFLRSKLRKILRFLSAGKKRVFEEIIKIKMSKTT